MIIIKPKWRKKTLNSFGMGFMPLIKTDDFLRVMLMMSKNSFKIMMKKDEKEH